MNTYNAIINGTEVKTDQHVEIFSPITNEAYGKVSALNADQIDQAYKSARLAQKGWASLDIKKRAEILEAWCLKLEENLDLLTNTIVHEVGKNIKDSRVEVIRSIEYIRYTIEEAYRLQPDAYSGEGFPNGSKKKTAIVRNVPLGVVCAISPFNYPVNLSIAKIAPALIMGNTVVFKPATNGSIVGILITKLLIEAGIPNGVINVVTGRGRDIGDVIVTNPEVDFVSFTGGTKTGKHISKLLVMKPQVMELGGKDASLVVSNDDLEFVAKDIVQGAFNFSGQRCTATKRVLVLDEYADQLVKLVKVEVEKLTVGSALENNEVVPLVDLSSANFVQALVDDAAKKGATIVTGNKQEGNLIYPTLLDNVTTQMDIAFIEPFGPVLPIIRVKTVDEAIELHNASNFGLQASVYTNNINDLFTIAEQLETGSVNLNSKSGRGPDSFPFIGVKDSGLGVQGIGESLKSMTRAKLTVINIK
jgi:glyceraldehyde-3-phosphate dehydrogenase (NADP+)